MWSLAIFAALAIAHNAVATEPEDGATNAENGVLVGHLFPACNGRRAGGHKKWSMQPDVHCLATPGLGLQVLSPATCANGTRAKLALFADPKCADRKVTAEKGLIELLDSEIGRRSCFSTWNELRVVGEDDMQKIRGVAFFCDPSELPENPKELVPEKKEPVPLSLSKKASVSHNSCWNSKHGPTAPTFLHPSPDTCQRLPAGRPLRIGQPGACEDGSRPKLARYTGGRCSPQDALPLIDITDDGEIKKCLDWTDGDDGLETSYGFSCGGVKEIPGRGQGRSRNRGSGILGFVIVLCFIGLISILGCVFAALRWASLLERVMVSQSLPFRLQPLHTHSLLTTLRYRILSGGLARALSGSEFRIGLAAKTQSPAGSGHARRELLQQGLGASLYTYTALMYIIKSPNILLVNAAISCFHPSMIRPGSEMYPRSGLFPFLVL